MLFNQCGSSCWKPQRNTSNGDYNRGPYQVLDIIEESIYEKSMWDPFDVNSHINIANYSNH